MPRPDRLQGGGGVPAHLGTGPQQAVPVQNVQGGQPGGQADRELAEGQRLVTGLEPGQRRAGQHPGQREASADALAEDQDVRDDPVVLGRPHPPGPAEPGLHLVEDQQDVMLAQTRRTSW